MVWNACIVKEYIIQSKALCSCITMDMNIFATQKKKKGWLSQTTYSSNTLIIDIGKYMKDKLKWTFNSLIFSWRSSFESFNFSASLRKWVTMRTASLKITALSIFGGFPGSKMDPNSKNLIIKPKLRKLAIKLMKFEEKFKDFKKHHKICIRQHVYLLFNLSRLIFSLQALEPGWLEDSDLTL